jgi:hypothetical protein
MATAAMLFLSSCGGGWKNPSPFPPASAPCVAGFSNNTTLPTSTLQALWSEAQVDLSTEPIPYLNGTTQPPNPAAATLQPDCQAVVAVPDLTDAQLEQITGNAEWLNHAQPTGVFICAGQTVNGCYENNTVYCAASLCAISLYEMENALLCRLNECEGR